MPISCFSRSRALAARERAKHALPTLPSLTLSPCHPSRLALSQDQTAKAADGLATEAGQKTDAAAKEGGANLEAAQTYLAGLAQNVTVRPALCRRSAEAPSMLTLRPLVDLRPQNTITNLSHQLDDRTATPSHPGVVTQASSLFSSAAGFVQSHLPASTGEAAQKTEATGTAVADAARSKADEAEITDALRELAQGGKEALGEAKGTVVGDVQRP